MFLTKAAKFICVYVCVCVCVCVYVCMCVLSHQSCLGITKRVWGCCYSFEKRYYVFDQWGKVCQSECVCVCVCVCLSSRLWQDGWLSNMVSSDVSNIYKYSKLQHLSRWSFPDPDDMDQQDHITFWPLTA